VPIVISGDLRMYVRFRRCAVLVLLLVVTLRCLWRNCRWTLINWLFVRQDAAVAEQTVAGWRYAWPGRRLSCCRDCFHSTRRGICLLLPQCLVPGPNTAAAQVSFHCCGYSSAVWNKSYKYLLSSTLTVWWCAVTPVWATVCKTVCPVLTDCCLSVCLSCPGYLSVCRVCDVDVLWPNGWMDEDATW